MRVSASKIAGFTAWKALALLLFGLVLLVGALLLAPGPKGERELPVAYEQNPPSVDLSPGTLTDPSTTGARAPPWEPGVVLPPDSTVRSGAAPTSAIIRGRVVAASWVLWPRRAVVVLTRQADGAEVARAEPSQESPDFRFDQVPFGDYRLRLEASEFEELVMLISASQSAPDMYQTMPLTPAASVRGRVKDAQGELVPDIFVTVEPRLADPRQPALPMQK